MKFHALIRDKKMLSILIFFGLLIMASSEETQLYNGNPDNQTHNESITDPRPFRGDQTIMPTPDTNPEILTKIYEDQIVRTVIETVRNTLPSATDTEILIMLLLWIWGFTMLSVVINVFIELICQRVIDKVALTVTIAVILFITIPALAKHNPNDIYGRNQEAITRPFVPAMLVQDQDRAVSGESTIRTYMDRAKLYYTLDIKRIIGWTRSSMPGATDIELALMLCLWIWGFSVINFVSVLALCIRRTVA
ncbi:hypothetical protein GHT06_014351 [Daphnia sinensis]|uniref:Uncharacterized protein n=1 Tax=Daphnia sinensis TaxID=1820382 RepID=A0AAD5KVI0_9CRUS|nr:hypothetical protein GHT06_014351 [Daphnia sinensis]